MSHTYVLVHGAFSDETAWQYVMPIMQKAGATAVTVTLPGHDDAESATAGRFTLTDYVAAITAKLNSVDGAVIVVGHSMGGIAITQTAEENAAKIAALVYLSAYLPENGRTLLSYAEHDGESKLGAGLQVDQLHGIATISHETMQTAFFNNTPADIAAAGQKRLRPEPLQPFVNPVTTTEPNFGRLPRFYITTLRDQAVGPALQKTMYAALPVNKLYTLDTDHSSYFSKTEELAAALLDIGKQVGES